METRDRVQRRGLSSAEQVYLERLNTNLLHAQRALEAAVDFLREQHEAQAVDGWRLEDLTVGFVRDLGTGDQGLGTGIRPDPVSVISPDELAELEDLGEER